MTKTIFICKNPLCKKEFEDFFSNRRVYCSRDCKNQHFKIRYKGKNHPSYGRHCTEETKRKIGDKHKNIPCTEETKLKISGKLIGKRRKVREIRICKNIKCNKGFECLPSDKKNFVLKNVRMIT
jgi:hypothetical protein